MILRERIKRSLASYPAYVLASEARWNLAQCFKTIRGTVKERAVVSLKTDRPARGTVLLSYILAPFLQPETEISNSHTRDWESLQMARTFLALGYNVDAISWRNNAFKPIQDYVAVIDVRHNMQRFASLVDRRTVKIFHIDIAHVLFHNAAEASRLLALQQRRGVVLRPRRFEWPNLGIEHANCGTILGNQFTVQTYKYARKPLFQLPIPSAFMHPWLKKDWNKCRKHFLYFSSGGFVHKGLDLALEAFADMPDCHLTVCGPLDQEPDFVQAYGRELFKLRNIHAIGWVNVASPEFIRYAESCIGVISPTCSEGSSGALVTCLHASLIPIASYESGVDLGNFGLLLKDCSVAEIRKAVEHLSAMPTEELETRSRQAWEYANSYHTREQYAERYRRAISSILNPPSG